MTTDDRGALSPPVRERVFAAVLRLGELMEAHQLARLTFPDGSFVTGLVVELNMPGGSQEYARPSVVLQLYAGAGLNRRVDRVVVDLYEDALPTIEAATDLFGPPRPLRLLSDAVAPPPAVAAATVAPDRLAARKDAETKIEVVFEQFTGDAETALLYRILRRRGWSDDRSDAVLAKARWNG